MKEIQLFGGEQNAPEGIKVLFMFLVTANSGLSCDSQQESLPGILPSESFADQILFYFFSDCGVCTTTFPLELIVQGTPLHWSEARESTAVTRTAELVCSVPFSFRLCSPTSELYFIFLSEAGSLVLFLSGET